MYSGSTMTRLSGNMLGAHQKIDRIARRNLERMLPGCSFPTSRRISHFEGNNGPDAIKRKSPAKDEPWHYFQPFDESDTQLLELIEDHYVKLTVALRQGDMIRSAFEAAWLAHAIVDGLTPAHHYPYEDKLIELRGGLTKESRNTVTKKLVFPGDTRRAQVKNNWEYWGPKGLFSTHAAFEWGVSTLIMPLRLYKSKPSQSDIDKLQDMGVARWFRSVAQDVARLELYESFIDTGWTTSLARRVRRELAPSLARAVSVIWYGALLDAKRVPGK